VEEVVVIYDDIHNAAVSGNVEQLKQLLIENPKSLNETFDADKTAEGVSIKYTVVFPIIDHMAGNVKYDILDVLAENGLSFNIPVSLVDANGVTTKRPLLEYAIWIWKDLKLTQYMLEHGADPNACNVKDKNYTTLLWYAIMKASGTEMLETLLKYGADPELCCKVWSEDNAVYQYLPPLFYALVEKGDMQQTICLIQYGASPQCGIDVGTGFQHNTNFRNYLKLCYPQLSSSLVQAFDKAQKLPVPDVVQKKQQKKPEKQSMESVTQVVKSNDAQQIRSHTLNAGSHVTSLKRCYTKGSAYLFGNFGILAVAFCVLAPIIFLKKQESELAMGCFIVGIPCALIAFGVWSRVKKQAAHSGQVQVMGQFVIDSILLFGKILLIMTIVLIPLAKSICSNVQWADRITNEGLRVMVKKTGDGEYEDTSGKKYTE